MRRGINMYSICIFAIDKKHKRHNVYSTPFEGCECINVIVQTMLESLINAPRFCYPDTLIIKNMESGAMGEYAFDSDNNAYNERAAGAFISGWIARDMEVPCGESEGPFDPKHTGFKILLEYFMMPPEQQQKRHADYAELIAGLITRNMG